MALQSPLKPEARIGGPQRSRSTAQWLGCYSKIVLAERPLRDRPHTDALLVEDLVKKFLAGQIRIPSFQRALKWGAKDVQRLLDSVYRGFPIGSLLMWKRPSTIRTFSIAPSAPGIP